MTSPLTPTPILETHLPRLTGRWQAREMSDAAYAASYFLCWQLAVHGQRCASRRVKGDPKPDAASWVSQLEMADSGALLPFLTVCFERYQFFGIIPGVPTALRAWLRGNWPLTLTHRVPTPEEVLCMQVNGTRPVTVIADYPRLLRPVLSKANGFAFLVHDLEHAYKFFHDPRLHFGQRRFFGLLLAALRQGMFDPYRRDGRFASQLDYLISDMNTHAVHGFRYLGAVLIECLLRRDGKDPQDKLGPAAEAELTALLRGLGLLWGFGQAAQDALLRLVAGGFRETDARLLESAVAGP